MGLFDIFKKKKEEPKTTDKSLGVKGLGNITPDPPRKQQNYEENKRKVEEHFREREEKQAKELEEGSRHQQEMNDKLNELYNLPAQKKLDERATKALRDLFRENPELGEAMEETLNSRTPKEEPKKSVSEEELKENIKKEEEKQAKQKEELKKFDEAIANFLCPTEQESAEKMNTSNKKM